MGISEATFYFWKEKHANRGGTEIRELRQLRDAAGVKIADSGHCCDAERTALASREIFRARATDLGWTGRVFASKETSSAD
jgi:hypothetical protein